MFGDVNDVLLSFLVVMGVVKGLIWLEVVEDVVY